MHLRALVALSGAAALLALTGCSDGGSAAAPKDAAPNTVTLTGDVDGQQVSRTASFVAVYCGYSEDVLIGMVGMDQAVDPTTLTSLPQGVTALTATMVDGSVSAADSGLIMGDYVVDLSRAAFAVRDGSVTVAASGAPVTLLSDRTRTGTAAVSGAMECTDRIDANS